MIRRRIAVFASILPEELLQTIYNTNDLGRQEVSIIINPSNTGLARFIKSIRRDYPRCRLITVDGNIAVADGRYLTHFDMAKILSKMRHPFMRDYKYQDFSDPQIIKTAKFNKYQITLEVVGEKRMPKNKRYKVGTFNVVVSGWNKNKLPLNEYPATLLQALGQK